MQQYMTRRLVAAQAMTYCEWPLRPGDEFQATPIDAEYLLRNKRATEAPPSTAFAEPAPVQQLADPEPIAVQPESIEKEATAAPETVEAEAEPVEAEPVRARRPYVRRKAAAE